jgi:uncharacterized protein (TIGR02266 family)
MSGRKAMRPDPESVPADAPKRPKPSKRPSIVVVGARDRKTKGRKNGVENRRHPRLPLVVRAEVGVDGNVQRGYLTNLSLGGAFLATEKPLAAGTSFHLLVFLPWKLGEFEAGAKVVWSSGKAGSKTYPPGVGLAFTELDAQGERSLRRYVERFYQLVAQIEE